MCELMYEDTIFVEVEDFPVDRPLEVTGQFHLSDGEFTFTVSFGDNAPSITTHNEGGEVSFVNGPFEASLKFYWNIHPQKMEWSFLQVSVEGNDSVEIYDEKRNFKASRSYSFKNFSESTGFVALWHPHLPAKADKLRTKTEDL